MFDEITHQKQRAFLLAYADIGSIKDAAAACGQSRTNHYEWLREDPAYSAAIAQARVLAIDALEDEARMRANDPGRKSDRVLLRLLEVLQPERWGKKETHEHTHHAPTVDFSQFTDAELDTLEQLAIKARREPGLPGSNPVREVEAIEPKAGQDVPGGGPVESEPVPEAT